MKVKRPSVQGPFGRTRPGCPVVSFGLGMSEPDPTHSDDQNGASRFGLESRHHNGGKDPVVEMRASGDTTLKVRQACSPGAQLLDRALPNSKTGYLVLTFLHRFPIC